MITVITAVAAVTHYTTTLRHRGATSKGDSRELDEGKPQGRSMQECPLKRAWSRCA